MNFTDKQKEIVARKLGYDGPMQGFDEFLNSSPSLGMKYSMLSDKFATRMAKGGMARKKYAVGGAVTNEQIQSYLSSNPGLSDTQIASAMQQFNVSPAQMAAATGVNQAEVQSRFEAATRPATAAPAPTAVAPVTTAATTAAPATTTGTAVSGGYTGGATPTGMGVATTAAPTPAPAPMPAPVAPTIEEVRTYLSSNPSLTDKQIADKMVETGATVSQVAAATGLTAAEVQQRFDAARPAPAPVVSPTVTAAPAAAVTPAPPTDAAVTSWFTANPTASDVDIAAAMTQHGVTAAQISKATGVPVAEVQNRFAVASKPEVLAIKAAYNSGNIAGTQAAFDKSGLSSDELMSVFNLKQADIDYIRGQGIQIKPTTAEVTSYLQNNPGLTDFDIKKVMDQFGVTVAQVAAATGVPVTEVQTRYNNAQPPVVTTTTPTTTTPTTTLPPIINTKTGGGITTGGGLTVDAKGAPVLGAAPFITAAQTEMTAGMTPTAAQAGATQQAGVTNIAAPTPVSLPTPITTPTITAASASGGVTTTLAGLAAQTGTVSDAAKIAAATQEPITTAVAGMEAAQGVAGTVQGAPTRTVQEGEMVSGPAVDMAKVEQTLAQTQAAQGVVTEDMTVQGQLNKLLTNFDAGSPPPWAAASMRAANAQMAARGLGASSMAGQAIIQATLEAATPIAAADAKVFETMGLQNLSNRQQTAMLVGQQRAAFLGQEFDQAFQTRVLNAARVADIANKNFDAGTQIAIENSRLANSMDIANLSAKNAVVLSKMAQMSQLETQNLSNRQQAAVENAKAFLTMDIKNLDNRQQTALFRAQEMNDALISDAGFANAVNITNAQNTLDAAKVSAQLALSAETFNADMFTKVNMSNALAANEIGKFNAQQANAREEFNSSMTNQINLANAKIIAEISTANTAATNAANAVNAKNATDLSAAAYAQQSQTYRDLLEMSWKTGESEKDRATSIVAATLSANASTNAATTTANSAALANIAKAGITLLANYDKVKTAGSDIMNFFNRD